MKPVDKRDVKYFEEDDGSRPVATWLQSLLPYCKVEYSKIIKQIDRAGLGNFGEHRFLDGGLGELKIDYGPGYRVYFGIDGKEFILLLHGGTKKGQSQDIATAKDRWKRYLYKKQRERKNGK